MALYEYTIRTETREIGGLLIGRYGYAYKHSFSASNFPGGRGRRCRAAAAIAEGAQHRLRNVRHFVQADSFKEAADGGWPVIEIDRDPPVSFTDDLRGTVIGHLHRRAGRLVLDRL